MMLSRDEYINKTDSFLAKLEVGLDVQIGIEINGYYGIWVQIQQIDNDVIIGIVDDSISRKIHREVISFYKKDIIMVRGDLKWNISNLLVECSLSVLKGSSIGYFYNEWSEKPIYYGRKFYSPDEINLDKTKILMESLLLKDLLKIDNSIRPYLEEVAHYGFIKNKAGGFDELDEEFVRKQNRKIYPRAIE